MTVQQQQSLTCRLVAVAEPLPCPSSNRSLQPAAVLPPPPESIDTQTSLHSLCRHAFLVLHFQQGTVSSIHARDCAGLTPCPAGSKQEHMPG